MALPHRVGACYCVLGKLDNPEARRDPEHKISPGFKWASNAGLKAESDKTFVQENYGGGSNAYFTSYPTDYVIKVKGSLLTEDQDFPEIEIKIEPHRNNTLSVVIDNRSVPTSYDYTSQTLEQATQGKGETMDVSKIFYWGDMTPGNKLFMVEFPKLRPLDVTEDLEAKDAYGEKKYYPPTRFSPWTDGVPQSGDLGDQNKANYLCSLRAPRCDISDLWVLREPISQVEDPPDSGIFRPVVIYQNWSPGDQFEDSRYASYYNTSSWRFYVKAIQCCWNKGFTISGTIKIAKRLLKFDPAYQEESPGLIRTIQSGQISSLPNHPFFIGHRFVIDEDFEPDLEYEVIPWTVTIDENTATGEWFRVESNDFDIPIGAEGSANEVTYICGFEVDAITPPTVEE